MGCASMRIGLLFFLALLPITTLAADPTGRVVVALGVCERSLVERPVLLFREVTKKAQRRLTTPFFGGADYKDETGSYSVLAEEFPAGQWELYNFELRSRHIGNTLTHRSRNDYSHRFTVEPGKLVDLGRFCGASRAVGETFEDAKGEAFNTEVKLGYFVVSANRPEDVERARKAQGGAALEVSPSRPPPNQVSRLLTDKVIEPRLLLKPPLQRPMEIPR